MSGAPWHCARKYRGWITYCGLDLSGRVSPSRRREFKYHADRDTFLADPERKCATCATAAAAEKRQEGAQLARPSGAVWAMSR